MSQLPCQTSSWGWTHSTSWFGPLGTISASWFGPPGTISASWFGPPGTISACEWSSWTMFGGSKSTINDTVQPWGIQGDRMGCLLLGRGKFKGFIQCKNKHGLFIIQSHRELWWTALLLCLNILSIVRPLKYTLTNIHFHKAQCFLWGSSWSGSSSKWNMIYTWKCDWLVSRTHWALCWLNFNFNQFIVSQPLVILHAPANIKCFS